MSKENIINYIDLNPGLGKTHWAIEKIKTFLDSFESDGVMIYVAPTLALLKEVHQSLINYGYTEDNIKLITSDTTKNVLAEFPKMLRGYTSYLEVRAQYYKENKDIDSDMFYIDWVNHAAFNNASDGIEDGDVLLITHEVFWRSNLGSPDNPIPNRDKMTIILDETRECFLDSLTVYANGEGLLERCLKYFGIKDKKRFSEIPIELLEGQNLAIALPEVYNKLAVKGVQKLNDIIARSGSSVFVKISTKTAENDKVNLVINFIQIPFRTLDGWKSVTIIASFYTQSQLYHIIEASEVFKDSTTVPVFKQVNISDRVRCEDRIEAIRARYKATDVVYVFNTPVSINGYVEGILSYKPKSMPQDTYEARLDSFFTEYASVFPFKDKKSLTRSSVKRVYTMIKESYYKLAKTEVSDNEDGGYKVASDFTRLFKLRDKLGMLASELFCAQHPFEYGCYTAYSIAKKWLKDNPASNKRFTQKDTRKPILLCINKKNFLSSDSTKELIDDVPEKVVEGCDPLVGDSRGLNSYLFYNVMLFLASVRPSPAMVEWFSNYCPKYDADVDRTLGFCIQTIMRCSLRNPKAKERVLLVLPDRQLAEQVCERFENLPTIHTPEEFGYNPVSIITSRSFEREYDAESHKEAMRRYMRRVSKTDEYKQYRKEFMTSEYNVALCSFIKQYLKDHYSGITKTTLYRKKRSLESRIGYFESRRTPVSGAELTALEALKKELDDVKNSLTQYNALVRQATAQFRKKWDSTHFKQTKEEKLVKVVMAEHKGKYNALTDAELLKQYMTSRFPKPIMRKKYTWVGQIKEYEKRFTYLDRALADSKVMELACGNNPIINDYYVALRNNLVSMQSYVILFEKEYESAKSQFEKTISESVERAHKVLSNVNPVSDDFFPRLQTTRRSKALNDALMVLFRATAKTDAQYEEALKLFDLG